MKRRYGPRKPTSPLSLLFVAQAMEKLGLGMAQSAIATTMEEAMLAADIIGKFPMIIRPAFTLGGTGGAAGGLSGLGFG